MAKKTKKDHLDEIRSIEGIRGIAYSTNGFFGERDFSLNIKDYNELSANFSMITGSIEMIFKKHKKRGSVENQMDNIFIKANNNNIIIKKINPESEAIIVAENNENKIKFADILDIATKLKDKIKNLF